MSADETRCSGEQNSPSPAHPRYPAWLRTMKRSVPNPIAAWRKNPGKIDFVFQARKPKKIPAGIALKSSERGCPKWSMVEGIVWKKTRAAIAEGRLFSAVGFL